MCVVICDDDYLAWSAKLRYRWNRCKSHHGFDYYISSPYTKLQSTFL